MTQVKESEYFFKPKLTVISYLLSSAVQTHFWSLEFAIHRNLEHFTKAVSSMTQG